LNNILKILGFGAKILLFLENIDFLANIKNIDIIKIISKHYY